MNPQPKKPRWEELTFHLAATELQRFTRDVMGRAHPTIAGLTAKRLTVAAGRTIGYLKVTVVYK